MSKREEYNNGINELDSNIAEKFRFLQREESIPLVRRETIANRSPYKRKGK